MKLTYLFHEFQVGEKNYKSTLKGENNLHFLVEISFEGNGSHIGLSRSDTMKRYPKLESITSQSGTLRPEQFFIQDFIDLCLLEKIPNKELQ